MRGWMEVGRRSVPALRRFLWFLTAATLLSGCVQRGEPEERRPQQAGQPLDPVQTVGHFAAMQGSAIVGDQEGIRRNLEAMSDDMRRAMRLPDPGRRIDREAARSSVRRVPGVRSVGWVDHENLLVRMESAELRSDRTIDRICLELDALGDTLAVVVSLQNAEARTGEEMQTLSRNCQLRAGERAFMQRRREMNVIPDDIRRQHRAAQAAAEARGDREARQEEARRILERTTPQM